jgi:hypothetical protein
LEPSQRQAWLEEINILQDVLSNREGYIYLEYALPRMGKRIDAVLVIGPAIFVLEFKAGETEFTTAALDQVCDYALDLIFLDGKAVGVCGAKPAGFAVRNVEFQAKTFKTVSSVIFFSFGVAVR